MNRGWMAIAFAAPLALVALVATRAPADPPAAATAAVAAEPDARTPAARREASAAAAVAAVAPASAVSPPAAPVVVAQAAASAPPDPRVPPIDPPPAEPPERAQPWELADPALYQARERRRAEAVGQRFVQAAALRLPQLRAAVEEMRARGASPADIARAEDKIRHLQAVQDALLRGEPLAPAASAPGP